MKPTVNQLKQLIGNPYAYAVQSHKGYYPVKENPTDKILRDHLEGKRTIGTYINRGDLARTLVFDIDELSEIKAGWVREACLKVGIPERSIGIEFSGSKGYHVWVVLSNYIPAAHLRKLGRAILVFANVECEVFPKQDTVKDLGNLVKLPCGLHQGSGKWSEMLTPWPSPMGTSLLGPILALLPTEATRTISGEAPPMLECMTAIQEGPTEGWRNHGLFHLATMLYRSSVDSSMVRLVVDAVNERCEPKPLESDEVAQLVESAKNSGPLCNSGNLPKDILCANCPVRATKGLQVRTGQVRNGATGEMVVVELGTRRKSGEVELVHPDFSFGLVAPK